jgi:hypothetical protein
MVKTLYRCHMAYQHDGSNKVWGAVVLHLPSGPHAGFYQYGSAWGRHGGHISSKLQKPESHNFAIERYAKATREKVAEGYHTVGFEYDFELYVALNNIDLNESDTTDATIIKEILDTAGVPDLSKEKKTKPKSPIPLPDLPCTALVCGHYLNSHATKTQTSEVGGRICLVVTCKCEQYRRMCDECGFTSVNTWTHSSKCVTGKKELALATSKDKPAITPPTIYVRQPRRIMHLISDDD